MYVLSIGLVWWIYLEKGKKNTNTGQFSRGGTGTKQSSTGTISVLSFCFGPVFVF